MKCTRRLYALLSLCLTLSVLCGSVSVSALVAETKRLSYIIGGAHARALATQSTDGESYIYQPVPNGSLAQAEQTVKTLVRQGNADSILLALQVTDLLSVVNPQPLSPVHRIDPGQPMSPRERWTDMMARLATLWATFPVPDDLPATLSDPPVRIDDYMQAAGQARFRPARPAGTCVVNFFAISAVERIKALCDTAGVTLIVGLMPTFDGFQRTIDSTLLQTVWAQLANQTDYWNFSGYHPLTADPRLFTGAHQYTETMGSFLTGIIFDKKDAYRPKGFGVWTTKDNVKVQELSALFPGDLSGYASELSGQTEITVPILMYHQLSPDPAYVSSICMTPHRFREQMRALLDAGYTPVFITDLIAYVNNGAPLPLKPIAITFDDGYEGNYTYAFPILKELGVKATINMIGWSVGLSRDASAEQAITPHFSWEQAAQMAASGWVDLQNHSYNLHTRSQTHTGARPLSGESPQAYAGRLTSDHEAFARAMRDHMSVTTPGVFCYPYGAGHLLSELVLRELGYEATLSTIPKVNRIRPGNPYCLYGLGRFNISEDMTGAQLVDMLQKQQAS